MVFLDFNLPNSATWFYLSLMLAVGLFFKFNRFFSLRNWDVLSLFLLVPGFLFLHAAAQQSLDPDLRNSARAMSQYGFIWLMAGSACFFFRCLFDLTLVSRPAMHPNLNLAGLAWLGTAMFICMIPVALRSPTVQVGKRSAALDALDKAGAQTVGQVSELTAKNRPDDEQLGYWVGHSTAILAHLAVIAGLIVIGATHFQNMTSGVAAAAFYLLLPYTAYHVGQAHHVLPAALMVWAIFAYRRPSISGLLLGLAAGTCFFPALTAPIWLSYYRHHGARRFSIAFLIAAGLSLGVTGALLWASGELSESLRLVMSLSDWQPWRRSNLPSIWQGVHGAYRLPLFTLYVAFVLGTAFWPSPKHLGHVISLSAAVLIGIQFWYADHGGIYVLWYLPLLVLMIFRPNLSDRFPPRLPPAPLWPARLLARWLDRGDKGSQCAEPLTAA